MPQDRPLSSAAPAAPGPRDWGQARWRDVLLHGLATSPEALGTDLSATVKGLAGAGFHGARQFAGLEPTTPGFDRAVIGGLRTWAGQPAYVPGGTRVGMSDFAAMPHQALQAARGVKNYAVSRYGSVPNLKRTLATDMPGVAMDVGAVASIPEGGEGFAGRLVRTVRGGPILDSAGAFTPKVVAAMEDAAPGSSRELANPAFAKHVTQTMGAKGITTPAAREAIVSYHAPGQPVPRASTLGMEPAPKVQDAHGRLVANSQMANSAAMKPFGLDAPSMVDRTTGQFLQPTQSVRDFTMSPEGAGVFTPEDASNLRIGTHAQDILNAPLRPNTSAGWWQAVRGTAGAGAGVGLGMLAGHTAPVLGHYLPELIGGALGVPIEHKLIEPAFGVAARQAERSGAPGALQQAAGRVAGAGAGVAQFAPAFNPHTGDQPAAPAAVAPPAAPAYTPFTPTPLEDEPAEAAPAAVPAPAEHAHVRDRPLAADPGGGDYKPFTAAPLDEDAAPAQADGGRAGYAAGGQVDSMVGRLMSRANAAQKAERSSTKPLLGLSDDVVARALNVAQRGL